MGAGGTGKSKVINGISTFLKEVGRSKLMVRIAMTGNAAAAINGTTFHKFLCAKQFNDTLLRGKGIEIPAATKKSLAAAMKNVQMLVFDEIGMSPLEALADVHTRALVGKRCTNSSDPQLFGGMSVLFGGDLLQLEPNGGAKAVWSCPEEQTPGDNAAKTLTAKQLLGLQVWKTVASRDVVFLDVQHRQKGILKTICNNLRNGTFDESHAPLLRARTATAQNRLLMSPKFSLSRAVVSSNRLREIINNTRTHEFAKSTGQRVIVFKAIDHIALSSPNATEHDLRNELLTAPEASTGYLPTLLIMCVGAPCVIKVNDRRLGALGVCNGLSGTIQRIVPDAKEPPFSTDRTVDPSPHFLKYPPVIMFKARPNGSPVATVRLKCVSGGHIENLSPGTIPLGIPKAGKSFKWPKCAASEAAVATVRRRQLPITMEFARTANQAQGGTFCPVIVNLSTTDTFSKLYVKMSRAVSLDDLVFLSEPDLNLFRSKKPSAKKLLEMYWMRLAEQRHLTRLFSSIDDDKLHALSVTSVLDTPTKPAS